MYSVLPFVVAVHPSCSWRCRANSLRWWLASGFILFGPWACGLALTVAAYLAWTRQALLLSWRALARSQVLFQQADIESDIAFGCYCVGCEIVPPAFLYSVKKCRLLRKLTRSPCVSRYSFLPAVPAAHSARTCTYRSMLWWLGFAFFKGWGCAVAESDRACVCYSRQQRQIAQLEQPGRVHLAAKVRFASVFQHVQGISKCL